MIKQPEYNLVFSRMYSKYYKRMCAYANSIVYDITDAHSITQDVFVRVFVKRMDISNDERSRNLLYLMVFNACIDHLRLLKSRKKRLDDYGYLRADQIDDIPGYELKLVEWELAKKLALMLEKLNELPEKSQTILKNIFLEGLTMAEYSERYGIEVKSGHNLKYFALKLLKKKLDEQNGISWLIICLLLENYWKN